MAVRCQPGGGTIEVSPSSLSTGPCGYNPQRSYRLRHSNATAANRKA